MRTSIIVVAVGACTLAVAACSVSSQAPANQPTAGSSGSMTAGYGAAPNISPNDPAYSENGAPRAGQPSGTDTAGAASATGNYAPIQHDHGRGGSGFAQ